MTGAGDCWTMLAKIQTRGPDQPGQASASRLSKSCKWKKRTPIVWDQQESRENEIRGLQRLSNQFKK